MSHKPVASDKRTRVDRLRDHFQNNRLIAVLLIFGLGLAALASLTESIKKLLEDGPKLTPRRTANFTGVWRSVEPDHSTTVKTVLVVDFTSFGEELVGTIHHGYPQALVSGKIADDNITFDLDQAWGVGGKTIVERQTYRGKLVGDTMQVVRTVAGGPSVAFTAGRKVRQPGPLTLRAGGK